MGDFRQTISILEAPSNLGLKPPAPGREPGVRRLPDALKAAGIVDGLWAVEAGRVIPPPYSPEKDPQTGIRNANAIQQYSVELAGEVQKLVASNTFPLVLGGDCSILIGNMLALRKSGRYGLVFIDGHTDFLTPATSQTGGAAGMDLALVTGRGPELLTNIDGLKPLVQERNTVVFGYRDVDDPAAYIARDIFQTDMLLFSLDALRASGIREASTRAIAHFKENGVAGFWIHLDADVLDNDIMPAVDSPQPGGMSYGELGDLLRSLLSSGLAIGMEITIFDPDLDPDGSIARAFTRAIIAGFIGTTSLPANSQ